MPARAAGLDFGPSLHGVERIWRGDGRCSAGSACRPSRAGYRLHPALLDGCLQTVAWLATDREATYLPIAVGRVELIAAAGRSVVGPRRRPQRPGADASHHDGRRRVVDDDGGPVAAVDGPALQAGRPRGASAASAAARAGRLAVRAGLAARRRPAPAATVPSTPLPGLAAAAAGRRPASRREHDLDRHQGLLDALERLSADDVVAALSSSWARRVAPGERFRPIARRRRTASPPGRHGSWPAWPTTACSARRRRLGGARTRRPGRRRPLAGGAGPAAIPRARRAGDHPPVRRGAGRRAARRRRPARAALPRRLDRRRRSRCTSESPFAHFYNSLVGDAVARGRRRGVAWAPARRSGSSRSAPARAGTTAHVLPRLPAERYRVHLHRHLAALRGPGREKFAATRSSTYRDPRHRGRPGGPGLRAATSTTWWWPPTCCTPRPTCARTFDHVARLLAPGGLLVLLEMTQAAAVHRHHLRPDAGLVEVHRHRPAAGLAPARPRRVARFLADAGFEAPDGRARGRRPTGADLSLQTVLVARRPDRHADRRRLPAGRRSWLILADAGGVGPRWPTSSTARGGTATAGDRRRPPFRPYGAGALRARSDDPERLRRLVRRGPGRGLAAASSTCGAWTSRAGPRWRDAGSAAPQRALAGPGPRSARLHRRAVARDPRAPSAPARRRRPGQAPAVGLRPGRSRSSTRSCAAVAWISTRRRRPTGAALLRAELTGADGERPGRPPRRPTRYVARLARCPRRPIAGRTDELAVRRAAGNGVLDDLSPAPVRTDGPPGPARSRSASTPRGSTSGTC